MTATLAAQPATPAFPGAVTGALRPILRAEGAAVLVGATAGYAALGGTALPFALAFLLPDLAMLGYLAGPRIGAIAYNAVHTYAAPALLGLCAWLASASWAWPALMIWVAHIGFDRLLGYGLKYPTGFNDTHLGQTGPRRRD